MNKRQLKVTDGTMYKVDTGEQVFYFNPMHILSVKVPVIDGKYETKLSNGTMLRIPEDVIHDWFSGVL